MPNEKIAETLVNNGKDGTHVNSIRIMWGKKDSGNDETGWVNSGFAHLAISMDDGIHDPDIDHYVILGAASMDHLIRTLKKIRRKTFDKQNLSNSSERV